MRQANVLDLRARSWACAILTQQEYTTTTTTTPAYSTRLSPLCLWPYLALFQRLFFLLSFLSALSENMFSNDVDLLFYIFSFSVFVFFCIIFSILADDNIFFYIHYIYNRQMNGLPAGINFWGENVGAASILLVLPPLPASLLLLPLLLIVVQQSLQSIN